MADETVTAASVLSTAPGTATRGTLGATVTQGQAVYKDSSDSNKWKLSQRDGTADEAGASGFGIVLTAGASGQPALIQTAPDDGFTPGFTAVAGTRYFNSATTGGITADIPTSGQRVMLLGIGQSDGTIDFDPDYTGETIP